MLYISDVIVALSISMRVEFSDAFLVIDVVLPFSILEPLFSVDWDSIVVVSGSFDVVFVSLLTELFTILSILSTNNKGEQYTK